MRDKGTSFKNPTVVGDDVKPQLEGGECEEPAGDQEAPGEALFGPGVPRRPVDGGEVPSSQLDRRATGRYGEQAGTGHSRAAALDVGGED